MNNILLKELKVDNIFSTQDDITYPKSLFTIFSIFHVLFTIIFVILIKKFFNLSNFKTFVIVFIISTLYEIKDLACLFEKKPELNKLIPNFIRPLLDFVINSTFILYDNLTYFTKEEIFCCNSLPNTIGDIISNTIGIVIALMYDKKIKQMSIYTSILIFIILFIIGHIMYRLKIQ